MPSSLSEQSDNANCSTAQKVQRPAAEHPAHGSLQSETASRVQVRPPGSSAVLGRGTKLPSSAANTNLFAGAQRPSWAASKEWHNTTARNPGTRSNSLNRPALRTASPRGFVAAASLRQSHFRLHGNGERFPARLNQTFALRSPRVVNESLSQIRSQPPRARVSIPSDVCLQ